MASNPQNETGPQGGGPELKRADQSEEGNSTDIVPPQLNGKHRTAADGQAPQLDQEQARIRAGEPSPTQRPPPVYVGCAVTIAEATRMLDVDDPAPESVSKLSLGWSTTRQGQPGWVKYKYRGLKAVSGAGTGEATFTPDDKTLPIIEVELMIGCIKPTPAQLAQISRVRNAEGAGVGETQAELVARLKAERRAVLGDIEDAALSALEAKLDVMTPDTDEYNALNAEVGDRLIDVRELIRKAKAAASSSIPGSSRHRDPGEDRAIDPGAGAQAAQPSVDTTSAPSGPQGNAAPPGNGQAPPAGGAQPGATGQQKGPQTNADVNTWMRADLARSGLTPDDVDAGLSPVVFSTLSPGYVLTYWHLDGAPHKFMHRIRLHSPGPDQGKYTQPSTDELVKAGCPPSDATHPYLNPKLLPQGMSYAVLAARTTGDAPTRWLLPEGEKKAAAAAKFLRRPAIGFGGCDLGCVKGEDGVPRLHPVAAALMKPGDHGEVVFDADVLTNPGVNRAAGTLRRAVMARGCTITFVLLPQGVDARGAPVHVGLDDWIMAQMAQGVQGAALEAAFDALPRVTGDNGEFKEDRAGICAYLGLMLGEKGNVIPNESNMVKIIERHERYKARFYYDEMRRRAYFVEADGRVTEINDSTAAREAAWIQENVTAAIRAPLVWSGGLALMPTIPAMRRNLVIEDIERETWDRVPRVEEMFIVICGAADTPYTRAVGKCWLPGAVLRPYRPGVQNDYMLVLEGPQGTRKSTFFKTLGGDYYVALTGDVTNKDFLLAAHGGWIADIDELASFRYGDFEHVKSMLTIREDTLRVPYGRVDTLHSRKFTIVGTTNTDKYLRDQTGNRRFLPIKCGTGMIDIDYLRQWRGQLLAEAKVMLDAPGGDRWWDIPASAGVVAEQEARVASDPWEEQIAVVLALTEQSPLAVISVGGRPYRFVTAHDILEGLGLRLEMRKKEHEMRVADIMKRGQLGWEKYKYDNPVAALPHGLGTARIQIWGYRKLVV